MGKEKKIQRERERERRNILNVERGRETGGRRGERARVGVDMGLGGGAATG